MSYQEIREKAVGLSIKERAALAHELLQTLEEPSKEEIAALWVEEAERRLELVEQGKMKLISGEEAKYYGRNRHT
jgi:putative addiction module component (TIGR02574 family)